MKTYRYTIILHPEEDGGFWVEVPSLRGCHTQGDTIEEAIAMAKDAIALYIESLEAHGEPIPVEASPHQAIVVDVAA